MRIGGKMKIKVKTLSIGIIIGIILTTMMVYATSTVLDYNPNIDSEVAELIDSEVSESGKDLSSYAIDVLIEEKEEEEYKIKLNELYSYIDDYCLYDLTSLKTCLSNIQSN